MDKALIASAALTGVLLIGGPPSASSSPAAAPSASTQRLNEDIGVIPKKRKRRLQQNTDQYLLADANDPAGDGWSLLESVTSSLVTCSYADKG